jgi:hypothetical protein
MWRESVESRKNGACSGPLDVRVVSRGDEKKCDAGRVEMPEG